MRCLVAHEPLVLVLCRVSSGLPVYTGVVNVVGDGGVEGGGVEGGVVLGTGLWTCRFQVHWSHVTTVPPATTFCYFVLCDASCERANRLCPPKSRPPSKL